MDKFTLIYNIIHDIWEIFKKYRKVNLETSLEPWECMMSDIENMRVKYEEYPRAHELYSAISLAILNYLDYTKE